MEVVLDLSLPKDFITCNATKKKKQSKKSPEKKQPKEAINNTCESNSVGKLHEMCAKKKWPLPIYLFEEDGPPNNKVHIITCRLEEVDITAIGRGKTKKEGRKVAAEEMLNILATQSLCNSKTQLPSKTLESLKSICARKGWTVKLNGGWIQDSRLNHRPPDTKEEQDIQGKFALRLWIEGTKLVTTRIHSKESKATDAAVLDLLDILGQEDEDAALEFARLEYEMSETNDDTIVKWWEPFIKLREICREKNLSSPEYSEEEGPPDAKTFLISCRWEGFTTFGRGSSQSFGAMKAAEGMIQCLETKSQQPSESKPMSQARVGADEILGNEDFIPIDMIKAGETPNRNTEYILIDISEADETPKRNAEYIPVELYKLISKPRLNCTKLQDICTEKNLSPPKYFKTYVQPMFGILCFVGDISVSAEGKQVGKVLSNAAGKMIESLKAKGLYVPESNQKKPKGPKKPPKSSEIKPKQRKTQAKKDVKSKKISKPCQKSKPWQKSKPSEKSKPWQKSKPKENISQGKQYYQDHNDYFFY